jgi:hypothetical protein
MDAINSFNAENKEPIEGLIKDRMAMSLLLLGRLSGDDSQIEKAREHFQTLLAGEGLTEKGIAYYHDRIAETWADEGKWGEAKEEFLRSITYYDTDLTRIMIAKCDILLENLGEAWERLETVSFDNLRASEKFDYCYALALLADRGKNPLHVSRTFELFNSFDVPEPYFRELRDRTLLSIMSGSVIAPEPVLGIGLKWLNRLNRYFKIQPAFMGLGVDANKIIDDLIKSKSSRALRIKET